MDSAGRGDELDHLGGLTIDVPKDTVPDFVEKGWVWLEVPDRDAKEVTVRLHRFPDRTGDETHDGFKVLDRRVKPLEGLGHDDISGGCDVVEVAAKNVLQ